MPLVLEHFKRSLDALDRSIGALEKDAGQLHRDVVEAIEAGIIQHFEVAYELSWKLMKRWIEEKGTAALVDGMSRRELFRVAVEQRMIESPELWMQFHSARNSSSHLYDADTAVEVLSAAKRFSPAGKGLLHFLEEKND